MYEPRVLMQRSFLLHGDEAPPTTHSFTSAGVYKSYNLKKRL